jgi:uncharacterized glyoxalase superfamily protein PhnB
MKLKAIAPQFVVPDVVKAAEYYRDVLGFTILGYWLEPPVFAIIERDNITIHFGKGDTDVAQGNVTRREGGLDAYVYVVGIDDLFDEFMKRRADIIDGPIDTVYGTREILIQDCYGFVISFGEDRNIAPS